MLKHTLFTAAVVSMLAGAASAQVVTKPTMDTAELLDALQVRGLTVTQVIIRNGQPGQFGTYSHFHDGPVTIRSGIVLTSGDCTNLAPNPVIQAPDYDPAGPPPEVNSQMNPELDGNTPEFDAYGLAGNIENFSGSYDVAALEIHFTLPDTFQVQFDFIFASVEFPVYTSSYTDAFLVFLDGTDVTNQIAYDHNGTPVQVGHSFAGLETTDDINTAFASPHAMIHHLTTTTAEIDRGEHVLIFEVGDVNDHILDSAVFLSRLRTGIGTEGTEPSDDHPDPCNVDFNDDGDVNPDDLGDFITCFFREPPCARADFNQDDDINPDDLGDYITAFFNGCP